jgi:hypothetical protein
MNDARRRLSRVLALVHAAVEELTETNVEVARGRLRAAQLADQLSELDTLVRLLRARAEDSPPLQ